MKIAVIGYSGSGKSTLSRKLGARYGADVLHFDQVHFLPGWKTRSREEKARITTEFMDTHESWIIDGNYTKYSFERRMAEADLIVLMLFRRLDCLRRVTQRYLTHRGHSRPDMTQGCNEKLDWAFVKWILWEGRTRDIRQCFADVQKQYADKTAVVRNQRQLDELYRRHGLTQ